MSPVRRHLSFWKCPGTEGENSSQSLQFNLNLELREEKPRAKVSYTPVSPSQRVRRALLPAPQRDGRMFTRTW